MRSPDARPRVALVLGAGGPVGRAFHAGVIRALADACGWDARHADLILGTSAGAQAGALVRAGADARELYAHAVADTDFFAPPAGPPAAKRRWPASPAYLWSALRRPWRARPGRLVAALLPEGRHGNEHLGDRFARLFAGAWPLRSLWITAVHLDSGARVVFGREGAPRVDVGTAVRCSSAVPGLRRAVRCGGGRFVDGGMASPTHLDLMGGPAAPSLVIVASPLSCFAPMRLLLAAELRALARRGVRTAVFEPDGDTAEAMGWNPMDPRVARRVAAAAYRGARERVEAPDAWPLRAALEA